MTQERHEKAISLLYDIKMYEDHQRHIPDLIEEKGTRRQTMLFDEFIDIRRYGKMVEQKLITLKEEFEKL